MYPKSGEAIDPLPHSGYGPAQNIDRVLKQQQKILTITFHILVNKINPLPIVSQFTCLITSDDNYKSLVLTTRGFFRLHQYASGTREAGGTCSPSQKLGVLKVVFNFPIENFI